jgi:hypothetical protein
MCLSGYMLAIVRNGFLLTFGYNFRPIVNTLRYRQPGEGLLSRPFSAFRTVCVSQPKARAIRGTRSPPTRESRALVPLEDKRTARAQFSLQLSSLFLSS